MMSLLIVLCNAGGLSGSGICIPVLLIFFKMNMDEAVPISVFIAVCGTLMRFFLNFNQMHPNKPNRLSLNYEIVLIAMPFVFLGTMMGV